LPVKPQATVPAAAFSADDRATRIADVIISWNVFRHFYPYFDIAKTDWGAILPGALREAAAAKNGEEFQTALRKMVVALKDGHGRVIYSAAKVQGHAPVIAAWIENKYIVTWSASPDLKPGDEIVAINGRPTAAVLEEMETLISGATPQWKRARSTMEALQGPRGEKIGLTVRPFQAAETKQVTVSCDPQGQLAMDARPRSATTELDPGYWYVDLTRAQDKDFDVILPKLTIAKGIVFDMRGYPKVSAAWFSHVTKTPLRSAQCPRDAPEQNSEHDCHQDGRNRRDPPTHALRRRCGSRPCGGLRLFLLIDHDARLADVPQPLARVLDQVACDQPSDAAAYWPAVGSGREHPHHGCQRVRHTLAPAEEMLSGQHLVKHHAKGPDIGPLIDLFPAGPFRRHIRCGSQNHPRLRHRERQRRRKRRARSWGGRGNITGRFGQPEIQQLHRAPGSHLDVRGLQVPVDHAAFVRSLQTFGDLTGNRQRIVHRDRALRDSFGHGPPFDQFHHQRALLEAMDGGDVGVIQCRQRLGFSFKPGHILGIAGQRRGQHFDGDLTIQLGVAGAVHLAHAARAKWRHDFIRAE
jgi:hypothetical protein